MLTYSDARNAIITAIEANADLAADYDLDAIIEDVYATTGGYNLKAMTPTEFWTAVERNAIARTDAIVYRATAWVDHQGSRVNHEVLDIDHALSALVANVVANGVPLYADQAGFDTDEMARLIGETTIEDFTTYGRETSGAISRSDLDHYEVDPPEGFDEDREYPARTFTVTAGGHVVFELTRIDTTGGSV